MLPQHVLLAALGDKGSKAPGALQERSLTFQPSSQHLYAWGRFRPAQSMGDGEQVYLKGLILVLML